MKKKLGLLTVLVCIIFNTTSLQASSNNYNYDVWVEEIEAAPIFNQTKIINSESLNTSLGEISDVVSDDDRIYVSDSTNNKILILNSKFELENEIISFNNGSTFNSISGLAVNSNYIIVADTGNKRVVKFDKNLNYLGEFTMPDNPALNGKDFLPSKLTITENNDIFIIASGIFNGIINTDFNGNFIKFTGVNKVKFSPMDLLWKKLSTKKQQEQQTQFLPTEFTNISSDKQGFLYTTTAADEKEPIKKLNLNGENVLKFPKGYYPKGDLLTDSKKGTTKLVAIDVNEEENYVALDSNSNRGFLYSSEGDLLGIFGNKGSIENTFNTVNAVSWFGNDKIIVSDFLNKNLIVLETTDFLDNVISALNYYEKNDLTNSKKSWEKVLSENSNYELAHLGLGKIYYREGDYEKALELFENANDREWYSLAFKEVRQLFVEKHFIIIAIGFVLVLFGFYRALGKEGKYDKS
ncbi:MAG: tetratricopeptide repeat protein [Mycoplasmatales bacterium]